MIAKEKIAIDTTKQELKTFIAAQPERILKIQERTHELNQELLRLSIIYNLAEDNPIESRDILWQMNMIRSQGLDLITPVYTELEAGRALKKVLESHVEEYEKLASDKPSSEVSLAASQYAKSIKETITMLDEACGIIGIIPNSMEQLIVRLDQRKAFIRQELHLAWKQYYLKPLQHGLFSMGFWGALSGYIKSWANFSTYWLIPYKENKDPIAKSLLKTAIFGVAALIVFLLIMVRLRRRFPSAAIMKSFFLFCFCLTLGLPLIITCTATNLGPLSTFRFVAEIILAAGLTALGWNLRRLTSDERTAFKNNPLWLPWIVFSTGITAQFLHVPSLIYSPVLAFILILGGVFSYIFHKKQINGLDKKLYLINTWLYPALLVATLFGWGSMSVLAATVWFAIALNIELVAGLGNCLKKIRSIGLDSASIAGGLAEGVVFPMIFLGLFAVTIIWVTLYIGGTPLVDKIIQWRLNIAHLSLNLPMLVVIAAILFIARSFIVLVNTLITLAARRSGILSEGVVKSLHAISMYLIWSLYVLLSLKLIGVGVTHLAIVAGGLSIGAGFGLQDMIKNFFSGLILLFGRSIHPGDEIQLENIRGTVVRINIRNTIVQTNDDSTIFIPNSDLIYKNIVNWTYLDPRGRAEIAVGVAYGSDTAMVKDLLIRCAASHPQVLKEPPPYVLFWDFGDSALMFRLRFWVMHLVQTKDKVSSAIRFEIEKTFKENNIEIAFPQQDIHIRSFKDVDQHLKKDNNP